MSVEVLVNAVKKRLLSRELTGKKGANLGLTMVELGANGVIGETNPSRLLRFAGNNL
jgi:hypothetical protein